MKPHRLVAARPASSAWTPADLPDVELWLDASDAGSITASGSPLKVSQWNDLSGNAKHAVQATGSLQPTTGATTQNGLNVLDFSGDGMVTPNITLGTHSVLAVCNIANSGLRPLCSHGQQWTGATDGMYVAYDVTLAARRSSTNSWRSADAGANALSGAWACLSHTYDGTHAGMIVRRDGAAVATSTAYGASSNLGTGTTAQKFVLAGYLNSSDVLNGMSTVSIAEMVVCSSALSTSDLEAWEDYAVTKWGTP